MEIRVASVKTSDRTNSVLHSVIRTRIVVINDVTLRVLTGDLTVLSAPIVLHAILGVMSDHRAHLTASRAILGVMSDHHAIPLMAIDHLTLLSSAIHKILAGKADRWRGKIALRKSVRTLTSENKASCSREITSVLILRQSKRGPTNLLGLTKAEKKLMHPTLNLKNSMSPVYPMGVYSKARVPYSAKMLNSGVKSPMRLNS
jgi:hypothetical protein